MPAARRTVRTTPLDRVIEFFDPIRARSRLQARYQLALAGQWIGGRLDRDATKWWRPQGGSADADNLFDLPPLRTRSRDLARNNPLALGALNTNVTSVVGTGLVLSSMIDAKALGLTANQASVWQSAAEREFALWAENPSACDAARTLDFYGQQSLAFRSALESGDVFAALPMLDRRDTVYSLKVNLVEADRVRNKDGAPDRQGLCAGVEYDTFGAPVNYHIMRQHPGGFASGGAWEWDVIPAFGAKTGRRNVIHLFDKRRPGQTRGMPYLAPVIESLKQLGDYTEAEITAAVVSGLFTAFIKTQSGSGLNLDATGAPVAAGTTPQSGDDVKMKPGGMIDLGVNEDVTFANPGRPNTAFDPFVQAVFRQIGVALEIPFEILVKHFTASYSAARAALLEAWRFFRGRRAWLAQMFCQPIYECFLEEAVARGRIDAPGFFDDPALRMAYCGAEWVGDSPGQIDPLKEATAAKMRLDELLSDRKSEVAALTGRDFEEVLAQRQREQQLIVLSGVPLGVAPPAPSQPAGEPADGGLETGTGNG